MPPVTARRMGPWRSGQWVIDKDGEVAIVFGFGVDTRESDVEGGEPISEPYVILHYVNTKNGQTSGTGKALLESLRQAKVREIPKIRIKDTPLEVFERLGYEP